MQKWPGDSTSKKAPSSFAARFSFREFVREVFQLAGVIKQLLLDVGNVVRDKGFVAKGASPCSSETVSPIIKIPLCLPFSLGVWGADVHCRWRFEWDACSQPVP